MAAKAFTELLKDAPKNWGRWGADDQLYNGYDAKTTIGALRKCSVEKIANRGVVGRGLLLDVARYKGVKHLQANEGITLDDLLKTAEKQKSLIQKHDILLIHTGWL